MAENTTCDGSSRPREARDTLPGRPIARCSAIRQQIACSLIAVLAGCGSPDPAQMVDHAARLREKGDHPAAILELKNALQAEPGNARARELLGQSLMAVGDAKSAEAELRRAIDAGVDKSAVLPALARAMLMQGRFQAVLDEIPHEAVEQNSRPYEVMTVRGLALVGVGRPNDARELFNRALSISPEYPDALLGLARVAGKENNWSEAATLIDRSLRSDERSVDGWMLKGELHIARREPDQARKAFQRLLAIYPGNSGARLYLAGLDIEMNAVDAASMHVTQAAKTAPYHPKVLYFRALIEYRKNKGAEARAAIMEAARVAGGDPSIQLLAGTIFYSQQAYADAQAPLARLLGRYPTYAPARKLLGAALLKSQQTAMALKVLSPTLQLLPNDSQLLSLVGQAYFHLGELDPAREHLTKALDQRDADPARRREPGEALSSEAGQSGLSEDISAALVRDAGIRTTRLTLAEVLLRRKMLQPAQALINALEKEGPPDPVVLTLKGSTLVGLKDPVAARAAFETALALRWSHIPAAVGLALLDVADGDPPSARRRLQRILDRQPGNVDVLVALARMASFIGATDEDVLDWLQRARTAEPKRALQALLLLGSTLLRQGDTARALAVAREAIAINKEDRQVLMLLGRAQMAEGHVSEAVGTYSSLVAAEPNSPDAMRLLAQAQLANGNAAAAGLLLRKSLELKPADPATLLALSEIEVRAGRLDAALKYAREAQRIGPTLSTAHVMTGDILTMQGKAAEAIKSYERALALRPSAEFATRMHIVLDQSGQSLEAERVARRWTTDHPSHLSFRSYYANFLLARQRYAEARTEFEAVLKIRPNDPDALNNLAWVLLQLKQPSALSFAERALKLRPNDSAILDTLGSILVERQEIARGIELLDRAITLDPNVPDPRLHLAIALVKAGDRARARRELEILVRGYPKFARIDEARQLLSQLQR